MALIVSMPLVAVARDLPEIFGMYMPKP